jgi:hypothetical protein
MASAKGDYRTPIVAGGSEEVVGQVQFQSSSFAASLKPRRARPPAMIRAIQLNDFGTDQSPIMSGQSAKILARWNSATKVKIIPATIANALWVMGSDQPCRRCLSASRRRRETHSRKPYPAAKPTIRAIAISMATDCAGSSLLSLR